MVHVFDAAVLARPAGGVRQRRAGRVPVHAVDGDKEARPAPHLRAVRAKPSQPPAAQERAEHARRDGGEAVPIAPLHVVPHRVGVRQDAAVAPRQPHDVAYERLLVLVKVMLPGGPVAEDALDDAQEDQSSRG